MTCPCPPPGPPTVAGFLTFIRQQMGITTDQLPDDSTTIAMAFCVAIAIVNKAIQCASPIMYNLAVYNLAGSNVLNYAQDPTPIVPYPAGSDADPPVGFFAYNRGVYNMLGFVTGVIQASADEATSNSMIVQEAAKTFTLANLQQLKDPYGRAYLAIAQSYGPGAWGLT